MTWLALTCSTLYHPNLLHVLSCVVSSSWNGICVMGVRLGLCWSSLQHTWSPRRLTRALRVGESLLREQTLPIGIQLYLSFTTCSTHLACLLSVIPCIVSKLNQAPCHRLGGSTEFHQPSWLRLNANWMNTSRRVGLGPRVHHTAPPLSLSERRQGNFV